MSRPLVKVFMRTANSFFPSEAVAVPCRSETGRPSIACVLPTTLAHPAGSPNVVKASDWLISAARSLAGRTLAQRPAPEVSGSIRSRDPGP